MYTKELRMLTRILFLGLLTQLLVACVTTKPQSQSPQSIIGQEVVVYRSTSFIGGGAKLFLTLNGESITLYPWTEHKVILPQGTHVITKDTGTDLMGMPMNLGLLRESLTFTINADETIKIGASFNNPFVFDRLNSSGLLINRSPMFSATGSVRLASAPETGSPAQPQINLPVCEGRDVSRWTNCFGTQRRPSGAIYVGEFKNGKPDGQGALTFPKALRATEAPPSKYVGEFKDGDFNGLGLHTYEIGFGRSDAIGRTEEGLWQNGNFVRAQRIPDHIAGRTSNQPVAQAPRSVETLRSVEAPRSTSPLTLSASASQPSPDGVVTLSITTNNATASLKINGEEEGGRADGRYSVRKFAQLGDNRFEVVAVDRSGNTLRQTVSVVRQLTDNVARFAALNPVSLKARPPRDAVAIIIGIQDYRRVSKADFANNDARLFYDYAIRGLGVRPENIKLLLDDKADDIEILGAFKNWLPLKTRKGQSDVYVFYSGHGYPSDDGASLYFLPHGVDRQFLDRSAIKQSDIVQALQAVAPKSVTLFLDACYSGQSRTGETLLAGARPISIQPKASTFPSNFTVLSASAPEQIASSSPELKHGIFSYFLMKGMEGEADQNKDGVITVQEMQSYLSDSVGRKAMSLSRTQQPQVVGDQAKVLVGR
jgi:hypothetical protein